MLRKSRANDNMLQMPPSAGSRLVYQHWLTRQLSRLGQLAAFVQSLGGKWQQARQAVAKATAVVLLTGGMFATWLVPSALAAPPTAVAMTVAVNTTIDEFDTGGNCSLREAVALANGDLTERGCGTTAATLINLGAGTYTLTRTGTENDGFLPVIGAPDNRINDLDVMSGVMVTITGAGSGSTILQAGTTADDGTGTVGNGIDRIFHILGNVTINDITIQNGLVSGNNTGTGLGGGYCSSWRHCDSQ